MFVQIGEEDVHRVRAVMDEVFGGGILCPSLPYARPPVKVPSQLDQRRILFFGTQGNMRWQNIDACFARVVKRPNVGIRRWITMVESTDSTTSLVQDLLARATFPRLSRVAVRLLQEVARSRRRK